jgi:uncharacterized protein involved in exopolysaccharide biosynthesis
MKTFLRWLFYGLAIVGANGLVWGICLAYLKFAPVRYTSEFTLIVPRSNSKATAKIEGVGQVDANSGEVFGTEFSDPRSDYNYILSSYPFLESVAKYLNISTGELGQPRTKAVDNSSLLTVEIKGKTGKDAQQKALAIYQIFSQKIDQLRQEEENLRSGAYQKNLDQTTEEYQKAREKLIRFQKQTGFNSPDQINLLAGSIEEFRRSKGQIDAERSAIAEQLDQLSASLGVNSSQAVQAFTLRADRLFQISLKDYADATNYLKIISKKWGDNHPEVIKARSRQLATRFGVEQRGRQLLGQTFDLEKLTLLNLNEGAALARETLYQDLISLNAKQASLTAKSEELQQKLIIFQKLYRQLILQRATYEELQRNAHIAEALFSSNVAALKGKNANAFASYPLFQLLVPPGLSEEPTTPKKTFAYLGAVLGSCLVTGGIGLLLFRSLHQQKKQAISERTATQHAAANNPETPSEIPDLPVLPEIPTSENGKVIEETPKTSVNKPNPVTESL